MSTIQEIFNLSGDSTNRQCVFYNIYRIDKSIDTESLQHSIIKYALSLSANYLWHKDPFTISIKDANTLHGSSRFDDAIQDEWFLIFLLIEISKKFINLAINVYDNDGDILLIQAAKVIPEWMDDLTSKNRVFIFNGKLHIIPYIVPANHADIARFPVISPASEVSLDDALLLLKKFKSVTLASDEIQKAAFENIIGYPAKALENNHNTRVIVPQKIIDLISYDPSLVAPAIEAFYTRDPIVQKYCNKMETFPPENPKSKVIKLTKIMYSQLLYQQFHAPKVFGLPPSSPTDAKAWDIGVKLSCGFEMLMHNEEDSKLNIENYDFKNDPEWKTFKKRLEKLGYYKQEIQGSLLYNKLDKQAKQDYHDQKIQSSTKDSDNDDYTPIHKIKQFLANYQPSTNVKQEDELKEDSDAWMILDSTKFDQQLEEIGKQQATGILDDDETSVNDGSSDDDEEENMGVEELKKMVNGVNRFLDSKSGVDGVDFEQEEETIYEDDCEGIEFNEDHLLKSIESFLKTNSFANRLNMDTPSMAEYIDMMEKELAGSTMGKSFEKLKYEDDDEEGVDLDYNLVKNLLGSITEDPEGGLSGPAFGILSGLGVDMNELIKNTKK